MSSPNNDDDAPVHCHATQQHGHLPAPSGINHERRATLNAWFSDQGLAPSANPNDAPSDPSLALQPPSPMMPKQQEAVRPTLQQAAAPAAEPSYDSASGGPLRPSFGGEDPLSTGDLGGSNNNAMLLNSSTAGWAGRSGVVSPCAFDLQDPEALDIELKQAELQSALVRLSPAVFMTAYSALVQPSHQLQQQGASADPGTAAQQAGPSPPPTTAAIEDVIAFLGQHDVAIPTFAVELVQEGDGYQVFLGALEAAYVERLEAEQQLANEN